MLSLSPRMDLFRFEFPKDFLPEEIIQKYQNIINKNSNVLTDPISYLNESIQSITIPGISDINIEQTQHGYNNGQRKNHKINVEPSHNITYTSTSNILEKIEKEFKVTFRLNQGLYNYFMIYETIFYHVCKPLSKPSNAVFYADLLSETGEIISRIKFFDVHIDGIEGLEFNYSKLERSADTFQVTFKFNNIDFDFIDVQTNYK